MAHVIETGSPRTIDLAVTRWMARSGPVLLRVSLGAVFLWFGALKFFPDDSALIRKYGCIRAPMHPASLRCSSLTYRTGTRQSSRLAIRATRRSRCDTVFPDPGTKPGAGPGHADEVFARFPYAPTLEGQYIIKNMVLLSAGVVVGATVRGGRLVADPPRPA